MTQEFHISVTPVRDDEFLVRTERVAPGVPLAEEQLIWPVEDWLAQARQLMNDPLMGLLESPPALGEAGLGSAIDSQPPLNLVEFGQQLYGALFHGTLRDSWVTAQGIAQNRREALRLRLGLKGAVLPRLPWEVLYGTDIPVERIRQGLGPVPRPLTAGTDIIFSRYQPNTPLLEESLMPLVDVGQPLRILMAISAPTDQQQLELYREANQLQQELSRSLEGQDGGPDIQLTILNQPGREQLTQALEQGPYQVLHYAGHSDLGAAGGSLYLVNNRTGLTEVLSGDDLAGLLVNNGIRLAVFNSCRGAYTATSDPVNERERNLAEALVSRGIPAVLAMAEQIPDNVALTLTWLFYRNLKQGYPLDLSLNRARQGLISAYGSHQLYWALPILYLHPDFDGYLLLGDRTQENPADQLLLTPQTYSSFPNLPGSDSAIPTPLFPVTSLPSTESPTDVPSAETWVDDPEDWIGEVIEETEDLEGPEDGEYDEDAAVVADLIRQLAPSNDPEASAIGFANPPFDRLTSFDTVATATGPVPAGSATPSRPVSSPGTRRASRRNDRWKVLLPLAGAVGALCIGILTYSLSRLNRPPSSTPAPQANQPSVTPSSTQPAPPGSTGALKASAIQSFQSDQYEQGQQAVTLLLDRGALADAAEALKAVPTSRLEEPSFNYLQGRLAWQAVKAGDANYTLQQARQYWEKAVKQEPDSLPYQEALGFAYYAEDRPEDAIQTWFKAAIAAPQAQPAVAQTTAQTTGAATMGQPNVSLDYLSTQAGIALALWRASTEQSPDLEEKYASKAIETYKTVTMVNPTHFRIDNLSQNWLWNETAIRDWEALAQAAKENEQG